MEGMPEFPGAMRLDLRLSAESGGRLLRVTVRSSAGERESAQDGAGDEPATQHRPREVVPVLLAVAGMRALHRQLGTRSA